MVQVRVKYGTWAETPLGDPREETGEVATFNLRRSSKDSNLVLLNTLQNEFREKCIWEFSNGFMNLWKYL